MDDFIAEAELMNKIPPHPHVVIGCISFCDLSKVLFRGVTLPPDPWTIVVNFCNEGSLYSYLHRGEKLEEAQKLKFAVDVAKGM